MKLAGIKLDKIINIWEQFVWNYRFIQKQIRFTEEVKTNIANKVTTNSKDMNYTLAKLLSENPQNKKYRIEFLKEEFKGNEKILAELNINNKMEYSCSYEYLRRGVLKNKIYY